MSTDPRRSHPAPPRTPWRRPPPWWPEDQPWPPRGAAEWPDRARRIRRRAGCALLLALIVVGATGTGLVWLILSTAGLVGSPPFGRLISGLALLLGIGALALAVTVLRRLTRPAASLVEAAQRIESGDYSARAPLRGPRELRSVARAFNAMTSRLEAEDARRQSVIADVAHELRTPLTVIRGQAEAIVDGVYPGDAEHLKPILAATTTLETLVADLQTLAVAETGGLQLRREPVDLVVLANETLDGFRAAARERGVALVAGAASVPLISVDPVRISAVVRNLVGNALRHTPRGGTVQVTVEPAGAAAVLLAVSDDGEGIAPDLLPRVFDRFVRGPASDGSGLGLAIVRDIIEAHGGTVRARNNADHGATVEVTLPLGAASGDPADRG